MCELVQNFNCFSVQQLFNTNLQKIAILPFVIPTAGVKQSAKVFAVVFVDTGPTGSNFKALLLLQMVFDYFHLLLF